MASQDFLDKVGIGFGGQNVNNGWASQGLFGQAPPPQAPVAMVTPPAPAPVPPPAPVEAPAGPIMSKAPPNMSSAPVPQAPVAATPSAGSAIAPVNVEGPTSPPLRAPAGLTNFGPTVTTPGAPSREAKVVGPQVERIEQEAALAQSQLASGITERSQETALRAAMAAQVEADRQAAYRDELERSKARHAAEVQRAENDYSDTLDYLATKSQVDPDALWNSKSDAQKVFTGLSIILSQAAHGLAGGQGDSSALQQWNKKVDQNIKAQEFAHKAGLDLVSGQKTAFGMLMEKYGDEEAARAGVRVALHDQAIAQAKVLQAQADSAEAASAYDRFIQALTDIRKQEMKNGLRFVPASGGQRMRWVEDFRGQGMWVTEAQAFEMMKANNAAAKDISVNESDNTTKLAEAGMRIQGERTKGERDDATTVAKMLQEHNIPQTREAAKIALEALRDAEASGRAGGFTEGVMRAAIPDAAHNSVFDATRNRREQAFSTVYNLWTKKISGVAVNPQEKARIDRQLGGTDPAARKAALMDIIRITDEEERNARAAVAPSSQGAYDANRAAARTNAPNKKGSDVAPEWLQKAQKGGK